MNVTVRQIQVEDKSSWQELYLSYLKFYESEPVESSTEILWNRLAKGEPKIQGLVAESNGEIVGIAHFHYQLSTWSDTFHCYLEDLYVTEGSLGKGVATTLIAEVKKFAIEHKCSEFFWITKQSNQTARKLYDKVAALSDFVRYEIRLED
ncbi:MAG: GNAT family N-acetyltransferase [Actinomycetes bacterium]